MELMDTSFYVHGEVKPSLSIHLGALLPVTENETPPPHTAVHSKENDVRLAGEQAAWLARASLKLLGSQLATAAQPSATALKADGYILFLFGKKIHSTINDSWSVSSTIFFYIKIKDDLERFLMASQ